MSTPPIPGPSTSKTTNLKAIQSELYSRCQSSFPADKLLFQQDLLQLKVIPNDSLDILLQCTQNLTNQNLLRVHTVNDRLAWKLVKEEDAAKYTDLTRDERLVYAQIESSSTTGMWTRHIKNRTNLHQSVVSRCLKTLETKTLIKSVRNVKHPTQKTYMLFHLQPGEDVMGGVFFTDGELDEAFIHQLGNWIVEFIAKKSWVASKTIMPGSQSAEITGVVEKKRKAPDTALIDERAKGKGAEVGNTLAGSKAQHIKSKGSAGKPVTVYLPYPPGYTRYPTATDVMRAVVETGIITTDMNQATLQQLLDILCFDGRLVKVRGGLAYKSPRTPATLGKSEKQNPLTEAPCGRCPVFDLCEEGGPINANNCTYFQNWLEIM